MSEKSKLDAETREANDNLSNNHKWLEENLSQMTGLMKSERQKTTQEVCLVLEICFLSPFEILPGLDGLKPSKGFRFSKGYQGCPKISKS